MIAELEEQEERMVRNVGIALDFSASSKNALKWAIDNLVRDGDCVIIIIVQPKGSEQAAHVKLLWTETGSPLIPYLEFKDKKVQKDYGIAADTDVLLLLDHLNLQKDVTVHAKVYWGDPSEKICDAATKIPLHALVMGSRGQGAIKRALLGSVSNYAVNHADCPVTVVK